MEHVAGGEIPARIWHDFVVDAEKIMAKPGAPAPGALTGSAAPPQAPVAEPSLTQQTAAVKPAALTEPAPQPVRGVPLVVDTGTLVLKGATVHLNGFDGETGEAVGDLTRYIAGREVACQPVEAGAAQYRCKLGEYDLAEAVVLNGAGRAAANAPERLLDAQEKAQLAGRGIWR